MWGSPIPTLSVITLGYLYKLHCEIYELLHMIPRDMIQITDFYKWQFHSCIIVTALLMFLKSCLIDSLVTHIYSHHKDDQKMLMINPDNNLSHQRPVVCLIVSLFISAFHLNKLLNACNFIHSIV